MPETSEEEGEGDVGPLAFTQAIVCKQRIRAAEMGALIGWSGGLAVIDPDDTANPGNAHPFDLWEKVQLLDDNLAAVV